MAARRKTIAYLGSCSTASASSLKPFVNFIFNCLSAAFTHEETAGLGRKAGDALSDFGDHRTVLCAINRILADPSKFARWRAARMIGELSVTDGNGRDGG